MSSYEVIGLMSGSSLDGLDLVHIRFSKNSSWQYDILHTHCYTYSSDFRQELSSIKSCNIFDIAALHTRIATVTANYVNDFIAKNAIRRENILLVASHGQTVTHQPQEGFTMQLGCGATLAALTGIHVVNDFRTKDIALGGQGAPMVPIGEKFLFSEYQLFLNIGGISNISIHNADKVIGYDCTPANTLLNHLSQQAGKSYDNSGEMARTGSPNKILFEELNQIPYYGLPSPKSMGTEFIEANFFPKFQQLGIYDALATAVEHIAFQISKCINAASFPSVLVTGGGAKNDFLIETLKKYTPQKSIVIPTEEIVDYKEAMIIGFAGLLRYLQQPNFLASVTGAERDSVGGALYLWY